jgi:hypothetical protein
MFGHRFFRGRAECFTVNASGVGYDAFHIHADQAEAG